MFNNHRLQFCLKLQLFDLQLNTLDLIFAYLETKKNDKSTNYEKSDLIMPTIRPPYGLLAKLWPYSQIILAG